MGRSVVSQPDKGRGRIGQKQAGGRFCFEAFGHDPEGWKARKISGINLFPGFYDVVNGGIEYRLRCVYAGEISPNALVRQALDRRSQHLNLRQPLISRRHNSTGFPEEAAWETNAPIILEESGVYRPLAYWA